MTGNGQDRYADGDGRSPEAGTKGDGRSGKDRKNQKKEAGLLSKVNYLLDAKEKRQVLVLGFMILVSGILETVGVSAIVPVVGIVVSPEKLEKIGVVQQLMQLMKIESASGLLVPFLLAVMGIYVVKNLFLLFVVRRQNQFICDARNRMISRVLNQFLNRPYEHYLGADIPTVFRLTDGDIPQTFQLLLVMLQFLTEVVVSGCLCLVLLLIDWKITLFLVAILGGLTLLMTKGLKPKLNAIGRENQAIQSKIAKWRIQAIYGLKDVKVLNREAFFTRNYYENGKIGAEVATRYAVLNNLPRLLLETIFMCSMLGMIAVYITGGGDVAGLMTTLTAFAMAAIRVVPSANRINTYITSIAYGQPSLDYLYANLTLDLKTDAQLAEEQQLTVAEPLCLRDKIELNHISYAYPDTDKDIFTDAHMVVPKGKSVGIMGPSGAGKSTIVDILLGLLHARSGEITCDGRNIFSNYASWLAQIGYIPQAIYLIDESIRNNIAFGIDEDKIDEKRVWEVLEEAQLKEFVEELPEGLETMIGERGVRLSGGQRQRLGIARALYHNPEILVFDEATSALDNETEKAVMDAVNSFHGKKTMIIIAHRLNTIANCDIIYKVEGAQILETSLKERTIIV